MKKIKFIFIILITLSLLVACEKELDKTPYNGLNDEQLFSTAKGFEDAMKGVYSGFRANGYYGQDNGIAISPDVMSDNLTLSMQGRQTQRRLFEWRNTPVDESFGLYVRGYRIISRANKILDNIDRIEKTPFRDNVEAEALAVRALCHFDIARVYCKIPTQSSDANSSMGIAYSKTYDPAGKPRRVGTTVKKVYEEVIADLEKALTLIGDTNPNTRITKNAILGLLTRVHLHNGDYDKVIKYADQAIGNKITIAPREDFKGIWKDEYDDNILFKIRIIDKDRVPMGVPYSQDADGQIRSEYVVSYELYEKFAKEDVRLDASVLTSIFSGKEYNHVAKYLGRATGDKNVVDGKYLRAEEIYLNKAEALYKKGNSGEALKMLDEIRKERYEDFQTKNESGEELEEAIQLERRLEFAFEGDRFFQLKRLGKDLKRSKDGEFADGTGTPSVLTEYLANGPRWQQPIPQGAFDANSELTEEDQNPGY